jgi:hypothetical protein
MRCTEIYRNQNKMLWIIIKCDSVTVWQCECVTVWQCDSVTVWVCDSVTVWQCDSVTVDKAEISNVAQADYQECNDGSWTLYVHQILFAQPSFQNCCCLIRQVTGKRVNFCSTEPPFGAYFISCLRKQNQFLQTLLS